MAGMSLQQAIDMVIDQANRRLPRDIGNTAYAKAHDTCPILSGDLFRSIFLEIHASGFTLGATAPHASDVEEGVEPVVVMGEYTSKIKRHKRKTKNGRITVKAHTKTFKNKKPVEISGSTERSSQVWRTRGATSGREGTFFMKKALESSMTEAMDRFMANIGATKNRK